MTLARGPNPLKGLGSVARFYGVPEKTITSVVVDHRDELEANGYRVLAGEQLDSCKEFGSVGKRAASGTTDVFGQPR